MTSSRILIGKVVAAHGLKGEVKLKCFATDPAALAAYPGLSFADGRKAKIGSVRVAGDFVIANFAGVPDRTAAEGLRGVEIFVDRAALPPTDDEEFYLADLIGCVACDPAGAPVGEVIAVPSYGAGDILEIRIGASRQTAMVPFSRDFAPVVDVAARRITLSDAGIAAIEGDDGLRDDRLGDETGAVA
jgi:16S rRNA processing protein RimM